MRDGHLLRQPAVPMALGTVDLLSEHIEKLRLVGLRCVMHGQAAESTSVSGYQLVKSLI